MRNEKLTAIIPVREGSQRVKNKNIKPFAGSTLLDIKIEILKRVVGLDGYGIKITKQEIIKWKSV